MGQTGNRLQRNRWGTIVLAFVVAGGGLAAVGPNVADAQIAGCFQDALDFPLFITDVSINVLSGGPDSVATDDGAVFVEANDHIEFTLTVLNRINPACSALPKQDTSNVRARITYPLDPALTDVQMSGTCPNLATAGATCSNFKSSLTVEDGLDGEHRVRFVVGNQGGGGFKRLAGAERILVVGLRPDLGVAGIDWATPGPAERHTAYGNGGASSFELTIENQGTYPVWNPNGARLNEEGQVFFYGRSAFDASLVEGDPDEAPDLRDPAHPEREETYQPDRTTQAAPRCIGDGPSTPQGMPAPQWSDSFVCSYVRGRSLDLPVDHALAEAGGPVVGTGSDDSFADPHFPYAEDKDASLLHAGNLEGAAPTVEHNLALEEHRLGRAGAHTLTVTLDRGTNEVPETDETNNEGVLDHDIHGVDLELFSPQVAVEGPGGVAGCGLTPSDPCPADGKLHVSAAYRNTGDPEVDGVSSVMNRAWKAALWMRHGGTGPFEFAQDETGEPVVVQFDRVHRTDEGAVDLWASGVRVPVPTDASILELELRLDDPDNEGPDAQPPAQPYGRVAERDDSLACSPTGGNVFCVTLYFDATPVPSSDLGVPSLEAEPAVLVDEPLVRIQTPLAGLDVTGVVLNSGATASPPATASLEVCAPDPLLLHGLFAECRLEASWAFSGLGASEDHTLVHTIDTTGLAGELAVCLWLSYEADRHTGDPEDDRRCVRVVLGPQGLGTGGLVTDL